jgi:hypothetical protein
MDLVQEKFNNFKSFLKTIDGISAAYIQIIEMVSLDQFLSGLKQHYADKSVNELITEVANKANINLETISDEIKTKFIRYISYFKQVSTI